MKLKKYLIIFLALSALQWPNFMISTTIEEKTKIERKEKTHKGVTKKEEKTEVTRKTPSKKEYRKKTVSETKKS